MEKVKILVDLKKSVLNEQEKRSIRKGFKRFGEDGQDHLSQQKTIVPGVSDVGIETRRGDTRNKGVISHGYARAQEPEKHAANAKEIHRHLLNHLKSMGKPSLPKVEKKQRIEPAIVSTPITNTSPITISSPQFVNSPLFTQGKDKK